MMTGTNVSSSKIAIFTESGWRFWWLAMLVLVADQLTKVWVIQNFEFGESIQLLPVFNFTYARNYGAAFSFLSDAGGWQRWFFALIALVISSWIVWQLRSLRPGTFYSLALALIMGGALGNLIDRLWLGMVVDFIDLHAAGWHWPAFNLADSAVCVGAVLYVLCQSRHGDLKELKV